jgi:hypothetical protein
MPESTGDAAILIAISHQAHDRAKVGDKFTILCDCTVMVVFAGFFIEANFNHLIDVMGKEQEMLSFWGRKKVRDVGLQNKLAWFYNSYVAERKISLKNVPKEEKEKLKNDLYENLYAKFPGFHEIYNFRNNISHGNIDKSIANLVSAERLRKQTKDIVDELFNLAEQATGQPIPRTTNYYDAIA